MAPSTSTVTGSATTTSAASTNLPKAITPDTGTQPIPEGTSEIQIAFKYPLNYPFVASHSKSAAQLLSGIPKALIYAGQIGNESLVQMRRLQPLDTDEAYGFITTIAVVTYPDSLIDTLALDIRLPNSRLYQNPDSLIYNITQQINSAIGITLGSGADGSTTTQSTGGDSGETSTSSGSGGDVFENNSGSSSSSSQKAKIAGISLGAIAIAGAYGAAMFVIARRYKRKRQSRDRASSLGSGSGSVSDMRQTGSPALMGGALMSRDFSNYGGVSNGRDSHGSGRSGMGNSGRTGYISAPVAAANSLGWN